MKEILILLFVGLLPVLVVKAMLAWLFLGAWVKDDCRAQGPDYIRAHFPKKLFVMTGITMFLLVILVLLDVFWLSKSGSTGEAVKHIPGASEYEGETAWPLWTGMGMGLLLGPVLGVYAAFWGELKCRRVLPLLPLERKSKIAAK